MTLDIINRLESEVRGYVRNFPTSFVRGRGHHLYDADGREYLDFFAGAGALNYGHNDRAMKEALIDYIEADGVIHSLDMATDAKQDFLETFERVILKPRKLDYRIQFPGPTGTNSVEAAMKLARKVTGRHTIVAFTNGFHGMTLGALAATGNAAKRAGAHVPLTGVAHMPYDGFLGGDIDTLSVLRRYLEDPGSGLDHPAAVLVETVQGEGGLNPARAEWLRGLEALCREQDILLIVDDIQMGCGRTGTFFSFEPAEITPDIVCLSKSIGGYGLPMALTLIKPDLDQWRPGEHNGTFRGNNAAFVTATAALERYWANRDFEKAVQEKGRILTRQLEGVIARLPEGAARIKGRGLAQGIAFADGEIAGKIARKAFEMGVIAETAGPHDEVVKIFPPLTIDEIALRAGVSAIEAAARAVLREEGAASAADAA